ncbi:MAG TPA: hypothetical protein VFV38_08285 [Ktedonobacteraceae bacterium]|nr:hypothetical protein [Ktedonobacteraceae bacterium]
MGIHPSFFMKNNNVVVIIACIWPDSNEKSAEHANSGQSLRFKPSRRGPAARILGVPEKPKKSACLLTN